MRVRQLVKCFKWEERYRDAIVIGDGARLNSKISRAQLEENGDGLYSTDADIYITTPLTEPMAVRAWRGFQAHVTHAYDPDNLVVQLTDVRFRLHDGTDDRYWDGGAWVVAGSSDWSTEQEIADNIVNWDIVTLGRKMRVVVNLSTTDSKYTPYLSRVDILYDAKIDFQDDMIYRTIIPALRDNIRPKGRTVFPAPTTTNVFNLETVEIETPYNFVGVDSAYDYTNDPDRLNDIFSSYDSVTKDVTLTQDITADDLVYIEFIYEPEVAVNTSQDYIEAEKVPEIVITDLVWNGRESMHEESVANKEAKTAIVVPGPIRGNLDLTLSVIADKGFDKQNCIEEITSYMYNNQILRSTGIDEPYRLWMLREFEDITLIDQQELHMAEATFRISNFKMWLRDSYEANLAINAPFVGGSLSTGGMGVAGPGAWTWVYDGTTFVPAPNLRWFGLDLWGKNFARLFGDGTFISNLSTAPLATFGLGAERVNKAIQGTDTGIGFFQDRDLDDSVPHAFPNPGSQPIHIRLVVKDPFDQGGSGVTAATYIDIQDAGGSIMRLSSVPGTDDYNLMYGSYSETISTDSAVVDEWTLIDFQVDPSDLTTQIKLFVGGVDYTSLITQPGVLTGDAFTSNPAFALFNKILPGVATAALNVQLAFIGVAVGRNITFARHQSDAEALELI